MRRYHIQKPGRILLIASVLGLCVVFASLTLPDLLRASFLDDVSTGQLEMNAIFSDQALTESTSSFTIPVSENAVPAGRISADIRFNIDEIAPFSRWESLFSLNAGGSNPQPYQIMVVGKKLADGDAHSSDVQFGVFLADPGLKSEEKIIWGGDMIPASELDGTDVISISENQILTFDLEWGADITGSGVNARLTITDNATGTVLRTITTDVATASFNGGNAYIGLGSIPSCIATTNAFTGATFKKGFLLGRENSTNPNTTYTCDTELFDVEVPELDIEETEMPGTGVIVQDRVQITPVDIDEVVADASGASIYYEPSVQELKVAATVDPNGNGDYRTIEDALATVDKGMIALAGGQYYVESITVPDGVVLSGGWDNIGFRTQDFVTNPTYIFQVGSTGSLIQLEGNTSGIEGLTLTSNNTCVKAYGRAHKITNNAFRCSVGVHIFGVAYAHIANNTFYGFDTGILLEDFSTAKIVNNLFKSGNVAIQENSAS